MTALEKPKSHHGETDWDRVAALSDDDIEAMAQEDSDNPATTMADWAHAEIGLPSKKTVVNAKFDVDVVNWFKAQGRGYQPRMNAVLRQYMEAHQKPKKAKRSV